VKILSIVGARPEFVQAKPLSQEIRKKHEEVLVHTGQHYDYRMSQTFFDELDIPSPDYNLEIGSGSHAYQTANIMLRLEEVLKKELPDLVIVRGDTNSTVASALTVSKMGIPLAHIEAGERSYNREMPEEINRIVSDHLADIHFCASREAVNRLSNEGIKDSVYWVGDVMLDVVKKSLSIAEQKSSIIANLQLIPNEYSLLTIHRPATTESPKRMSDIIYALNSIHETIVFPVHPRTKIVLDQLDIPLSSHIMAIDPVGYFDMLVLEKEARLIATDSGGVQREAYFLGIPCLTLREETEWTETVKAGWNLVVGTESERIINNWFQFSPNGERPPFFGDGTAAQRIVNIIEKQVTPVSLEQKHN